MDYEQIYRTQLELLKSGKRKIITFFTDDRHASRTIDEDYPIYLMIIFAH